MIEGTPRMERPLSGLLFLRREAGLIYAGQERRRLLRGEGTFSFVGYGLIAAVVGALDRGELDFRRLAVDRLAFLGGEVLGERFRTHLVKPYIAELTVALFRLEAGGEVRRLVLRGADQYAVVVDRVGKEHLLYGQRDIRHLEFEADLRVSVQGIKLRIVIGKERLLR